MKIQIKIMLTILIISLCMFLPTFAYFYEDYAKSNFYFFLVDDALKKYNEISKTKNINQDNVFYSLFKEYEKLVYAMNYYNIDNISDLYCSSNNPYTIVEDNRSNKIKLSEYYQHGFSLHCTEAMTMFEIDYNWLETNYGQNISLEYKKWFTYLKSPVKFEEGNLISDKKFLKEQIKYLEQFVKDYPNFVGISDVVIELSKLKRL